MKNNGRTPLPETIEYNIHMNKRRRQKERLLNAPYVESNNLRVSKLHYRDHAGYIQFRVSPFAAKVIKEVASLFGMSASQYAKAVLYRDVGLIFESVDRRRKRK